MYDGGAPYDYGALQCTAHANGAKIIDWSTQLSAAVPCRRPLLYSV
jgi:hypothetical protein